MSLNEFSTKLRYLRAKIRPLLKPVVWAPALLVLPAGYFLTEYLTSPEALSFWEGLQAEQETETVSEVETPPATPQKPKEQSKQQNQNPGDQKLMDQLRLANGQAATRNGNNAPAVNPAQNLSEVGGLESLLLPGGSSYNSSLGMNSLSGNKQPATLVPANPLQAALERYPSGGSGGSGVTGTPAGVGVSGSPASNLDATGAVPSSPNPNGASYLEAATGMPTVPVSPPVMATSGDPSSATGVTSGMQPNSYSYLTGTQPATSNQATPTQVPVVQVVTPALQNSGAFLQPGSDATVVQPSVSVPPQSTVPVTQVPLTPVPVTPVPVGPVPVGPVNYGPSAVSGGSVPGMPASVGNYGQGVSPSPGVGVVQPVMPGVGNYGSASYPNMPSATSNPGYPSNFINPGVQPAVPSQPNTLPSAIGGGNINTFSNPTGNQ